jgi:signal transduction histidine kinase
VLRLRLRHAPAYVRVRVTSVAALSALVATTVGSVLFVVSLDHSLEMGLVSTAQQEGSAIAAQLADGASPQQVVITGGDDVVVQLVSRDGKVVASDTNATMRRPLRSAPGTSTDQSVPGQEDGFTIVAARIHGTAPITMVVVGRSTEQADRARDVAIALLSIAVPVVVALLALIVWVSIGRALQPVEAMRREANAITSAHLHRRLAVPPGDDEIPRLALTLNEMLDRIDQSHRLQRQFVSDASHELRSPLSAIRQTAEVAHAYPDKTSLPALAQDVLSESSRLENLVNALLLLARLDNTGSEPDKGLVDLDDLVLEEVTRVRRTTDVRIDVSRVSAGQAEGSKILLGQVVRNLLDNAVRHATSEVSVSLQEDGDQVTMCVDDDGPGVAAADAGRIFERFVRLDEARAQEGGGAGLGLAIVQRIVEVADGVVEVGRSPLGGAQFRVVVPAAD